MADESRPFYTAQLNMEGCAYDVRVNDGPLLENLRGLPVVVEIPMNHLLRSGANEISLRLRPPEGQAALDRDTKSSAIVYVRESGEDRERRREVAKLEYPGAAPARSDGSDTVVTTTFPANVSFPLFRWFTAPEIAANDNTRAELIAEHQRFHDLLAAKNIEAILAAVRERDREHAAAYYETLSEQVADTRRGFQLLLDEGEYTLRPPQLKNPRLRIFGNGRLARLDLSNGRSPLYYMMTGAQTAVYVTLVYCRDAQGKWLVIR